MSNHTYTKSKNPFYDEDDEETDSFLKNSRKPPATSSSNSNVQGQSFQEQMRQIEKRTLESSEQSLRLLKDTERIGTATGAELVKQREQLEKTEKHLDSINNSLDSSQKHINGIKSVFGSLKRGVFGRRKKELNASKTTTNLVEETKPTTTVQSCDPSTTLVLDIPPPIRDFKSKLDQNLQECLIIASSMKNLALDVEEEINTQNDLIDRITDQTDQAHFKIEQQNKQMSKLLKK